MVPVEKTRFEIEAMMRKRGADQFFSGGMEDKAALAFRLNGRHLRFMLPLGPKLTAQQHRSRWRALYLVIKARLQAIDLGIMTIEALFSARRCSLISRPSPSTWRRKSRPPTRPVKCPSSCRFLGQTVVDRVFI